MHGFTSLPDRDVRIMINSFPQRDDCNTRKDTEIISQNWDQTQNPTHNARNNKQRIDDKRITALDQTAAADTG